MSLWLYMDYWFAGLWYNHWNTVGIGRVSSYDLMLRLGLYRFTDQNKSDMNIDNFNNTMGSNHQTPTYQAKKTLQVCRHLCSIFTCYFLSGFLGIWLWNIWSTWTNHHHSAWNGSLFWICPMDYFYSSCFWLIFEIFNCRKES